MNYHLYSNNVRTYVHKSQITPIIFWWMLALQQSVPPLRNQEVITPARVRSYKRCPSFILRQQTVQRDWVVHHLVIDEGDSSDDDRNMR